MFGPNVGVAISSVSPYPQHMHKPLQRFKITYYYKQNTKYKCGMCIMEDSSTPYMVVGWTIYRDDAETKWWNRE